MFLGFLTVAAVLSTLALLCYWVDASSPMGIVSASSSDVNEVDRASLAAGDPASQTTTVRLHRVAKASRHDRLPLDRVPFEQDLP